MKRTVFIALFLVAGFLLLGCGSSTGKHLFMVNYSAGNVDIYNIQTNGSLSVADSSPYSVGSNPLCLVITPNGEFAYVVNKGSTTISTYTLNNGTLSTPPTVGGVTIQNPSDTGYPTNLAIDPSGQFLYTADSGIQGNPGISVYTINSTSGELTFSSSFPLSFPPSFVTTYFSGAPYLYAAIPNTGTIEAFSINDSNGALTELPAILGPTVSAGITPTFMTFSGNFLLAADSSSQDIYVFQVQSGQGNLVAVTNSPFTAGQGPAAIAAYGSNVYVANQISDNVSVFSIGPAGQLAGVSGSPYATSGSGPDAIAVAPQGNAVYVGNASTSKLDEFAVSSNNSFLDLSAINGSPLTADGEPIWITIY